MSEHFRLPCPCCGEKQTRIEVGKIYSVPTQSYNEDEEKYQSCSIRCINCGLGLGATATYNDKDRNRSYVECQNKATEKWNTRVLPESTAVIKESLTTEKDFCEWKMRNNITGGYLIGCRKTVLHDIPIDRLCPFCGKPIKIKE